MSVILLVVDGGAWRDPAAVGPFDTHDQARTHSIEQYGRDPDALDDYDPDFETVIVPLLATPATTGDNAVTGGVGNDD